MALIVVISFSPITRKGAASRGATPKGGVYTEVTLNSTRESTGTPGEDAHRQAQPKVIKPVFVSSECHGNDNG